MEETTVQKKKVKFVPMVFLMYMFISGGAFGVEDMIGGAGPGITLIILILLPIVWAYPYGLVCTEMGAKYPEAAGMYGWIKKTLERINENGGFDYLSEILCEKRICSKAFERTGIGNDF